ncbi:unnamed protein product [Symbiodinium necroappetens]|uniref:Uncharacterized protein n=1 Tax=Symbiodinium necroappetens TaxID=1628268 RepID=A0A812KGS6_9DINO|nr:unnamed protein product [Symbiodinium necroappetens]
MRRGMVARCLLLLCSSALAGKPFLIGTEDLGDTAQTCNVDAVQVANLRQLHPILHDLVNTTFFRLFRVNLKSPICPYWKSADSDKEDTSSGGTCSGGLVAHSAKISGCFLQMHFYVDLASDFTGTFQELRKGSRPTGKGTL